MAEDRVRALLTAQAGVIASRQVVALGGTYGDVRSRLLRREWVRVAPAVYLAHTGRPTWEQRCWAAVLHLWPVALHRETALQAHGLRRDREPGGQDRPVHLLVAAPRQVRPLPGVRVERVRDAHRWVLAGLSPPRARVEYALLKAAASRDDADALALVADAVRQGLTTSGRVMETLDQLVRLPHRAFLREVLQDVGSGAHSVLERRYLVHVERAHGLPHGERQHRAAGPDGTVFRDVRYPGQRTLVELDGAFGHRDARDRWADLQRDLHAAISGAITLRAGWAQVLEPCRLAIVVAQVLQQRGWAGEPYPCGPGCPVLTTDDRPSGVPGG